MYRWIVVAAALAACGVDESDVSDVEQDVFAYYPMGFARVNAAAGVVTRFNSMGGAVTASRTSTGNYIIQFAALGTTSTAAGTFGNVQVTAEGATNARCVARDWSGAATLTVRVRCTDSVGALVDTPFAALYFRYTMPPPSTFPATAAYVTANGSGAITARSNYNSSGNLNGVTRTGTGVYSIAIANGTAVNASVMVTPVFSLLDEGNVCSISSWTGPAATVQCRNQWNVAADTAFSFSYAVSGPTIDQQGGHARFTGTTVDRAAALGMVSWCSPASVRGSRVGSLATVIVEGDLGSWDGGAFLRASMATKLGTPGYCKVESVSSAGAPPMSTGTTTVRCYSATGAVIAVPVFGFTHLTSDATGPC